MKETGVLEKILGFAGQSLSFRGPDLAHGPYIVHASKVTLPHHVSTYGKPTA
jgi:hypothetical protein